jgi:hypothetical protein
MGTGEDFELTYPFTSAIEFLIGNYALTIQGAHLTIGWIALATLSLIVFKRKDSFYVKFTSLYFGANLFNNFAYTLGGVRFGEFCGIIAAIIYLNKPLYKKYYRSPVGASLLFVAFLALTQYLVLLFVYQDLDVLIEEKITRLSLIFKIIVLGIVSLGFNDEFNNFKFIDRLIKDIILFAVVGICIYLTQFALFFLGNVPFGTYLDAGFTGFPSFGSVSIERGHFARLFAPLYPFFLFHYFQYKNTPLLVAFLLIDLINFSSSGQFYTFVYLLLTLIIFQKKFLQSYNFMWLIGGGTLGILTIINLFMQQLVGVTEKIFVSGLQGSDGSGRSFNVLAAYLSKYPWGTSYGGSTMRVVGDLPVLDSGIYIFIAQFSILSLPLVIWFLVLHFKVLSNPNSFLSEDAVKAMRIGVLVAPIIYCIDVLWFSPTIWLPLIIYSSSTSFNYINKSSISPTS